MVDPSKTNGRRCGANHRREARAEAEARVKWGKRRAVM